MAAHSLPISYPIPPLERGPEGHAHPEPTRSPLDHSPAPRTLECPRLKAPKLPRQLLHRPPSLVCPPEGQVTPLGRGLFAGRHGQNLDVNSGCLHACKALVMRLKPQVRRKDGGPHEASENAQPFTHSR